MSEHEKIRVFNEKTSDVQWDHPLKDHPRILALRVFVTNMNVDESYRKRLYDSLWKYADQIIERPIYKPDEGLSDEEALQQATLSDMVEENLRSLGGNDNQAGET